MTHNASLIIFPCDFPIKIIGHNTLTFFKEISTLIRKYFPNTEEKKITSQLSQQGNYLSITATLYAEDQPTLDALYTELTQHPDVKMVL